MRRLKGDKTMKKRNEKQAAGTPKMLEAVVKGVGQRPRVTLVANTLEAMQSIVGGYIEVVGYDEKNLIVCNEEGRLLGLEENALGICGPFIVLGRGCGDGEFGCVADAKAVCCELREAAPDWRHEDETGV